MVACAVTDLRTSIAFWKAVLVVLMSSIRRGGSVGCLRGLTTFWPIRMRSRIPPLFLGMRCLRMNVPGRTFWLILVVMEREGLRGGRMWTMGRHPSGGDSISLQ